MTHTVKKEIERLFCNTEIRRVIQVVQVNGRIGSNLLWQYYSVGYRREGIITERNIGYLMTRAIFNCLSLFLLMTIFIKNCHFLRFPINVIVIRGAQYSQACYLLLNALCRRGKRAGAFVAISQMDSLGVCVCGRVANCVGVAEQYNEKQELTIIS